MPELCPVCEAEPVAMKFTGPTATVLMGRKCARVLETLLRLSGADDVRRRPVLQVVE